MEHSKNGLSLENSIIWIGPKFNYHTFMHIIDAECNIDSQLLVINDLRPIVKF